MRSGTAQQHSRECEGSDPCFPCRANQSLVCAAELLQLCSSGKLAASTSNPQPLDKPHLLATTSHGYPAILAS